MSDIAQERADPELLPLIAYLEDQRVKVPRVFDRGLSSYVLWDDALYKRNFERTGEMLLLLVLRAEILDACHDDPSAGHLGISRILTRISQRYDRLKLMDNVRQIMSRMSEVQNTATESDRGA